MSKFSNEDQIIVRSLLRKLPQRQQKAIILIFWDNYSVSEVARKLKVSWEEADKTILRGLMKLRNECMDHPRFSRSFNYLSA